MASRMQKYYDSNEVEEKRSRKNASMYKKMDDEEMYSNIEGIVTTPKTDEIDIEKIRQVVLEKENERENRNKLVKKDLEIDIPDMAALDDEEKKYDIMDILKQAKEQDDNSRENKYRRLDDEYLKDLKSPTRKIEKLINTKTSKKDLNNMKDTELSLEMFYDLRSTLNVDDATINSIINEAKKLDKNNVITNSNDMDRTFDTASVKLKAKDYVDKVEDLETDKEKNPILNFFMTILFIMLGLLIVYILYTILK